MPAVPSLPKRFVIVSLLLGMFSFADFSTNTFCTNGQMGPRHLRKYCVLIPECEKITKNAVTKPGFSARGYDRILKVARTIVDLKGAEDLDPKHLSETVQYRTLDRNLWSGLFCTASPHCAQYLVNAGRIEEQGPKVRSRRRVDHSCGTRLPSPARFGIYGISLTPGCCPYVACY